MKEVNGEEEKLRKVGKEKEMGKKIVIKNYKKRKKEISKEKRRE